MSVGYEKGGNAQNRPLGQEERPDWDTLKEDVSGIADAAVERGRHFVDAARSQASEYADKRKNDMAQSVADVAASLREATKPFEDRPNIRAFAESAAVGLDQLADTIRSRSFGDIFEEVEDVVRRRPATIAVVTAAAGFLISRFIRASSDSVRHARHEARGGRGGPQPVRRDGQPATRPGEL
jgi:hypothetical protein